MSAVDGVASFVKVQLNGGLDAIEFADATVELKPDVVVVTQPRAQKACSYDLEDIVKVEWLITPLGP